MCSENVCCICMQKNSMCREMNGDVEKASDDIMLWMHHTEEIL